jgi:hypothetical protein
MAPPRRGATSYGPIRAPGPMATRKAFYAIGLPLSTSEPRRAIGGGDDADVDRMGAVTADAFDGFDRA